MTDYHPLLARAVEGLGNDTADGRRALYERARAALVTQLRGVDPPLSDAEITRERLVLEDAIRKVEAEAIRKVKAESIGKARAKPRSDPIGAIDALNRQSMGGAGMPTALAAAAGREAKVAVTDSTPARSEAKLSDPARRESQVCTDHPERADYEQTPDLLEDGPAHMHDEQPTELRELRPPRYHRGLVQMVTAVVILLGICTAAYWQWSNINDLYQLLSHMRSRQSQTAQQPAGEPEFVKRVLRDQARPQPPAATPKSESGSATAQHVVLYEEDSGNLRGKQYTGSATWRTETVLPGSDLVAALQIRAELIIPDRNMTITWSLRRNTDRALPASHTIEIMFKLPPDFPGGGVANVPAVRMKESEQGRGMPLAGVAAKVTNGFFLIGLSAVDADVQKNMQLLKEWPWLGIPLVYNNGRRAILTFEKGSSGNGVFADAFAAWGD
jgi:hypothetical protein